MPDWPEAWWNHTVPPSENLFTEGSRYFNLSENCTPSEILAAADGYFTTTIPVLGDARNVYFFNVDKTNNFYSKINYTIY